MLCTLAVLFIFPKLTHAKHLVIPVADRLVAEYIHHVTFNRRALTTRMCLILGVSLTSNIITDSWQKKLDTRNG
jgi:hypothetical protein